MRAPSLVFAVALVALAATGCGQGEKATNPSPAVPAVPTGAPSSVTGVAEVDAVINIVLSGDVENLKQLLSYTRVPCRPDPEAASTSPTCHPGETEGTPVDSLPVDYHGSGPLVRADEVDWTLQTLMKTENEVYAVFGVWTTGHPSMGGTWRDVPPDEYVVVFSQEVAGYGVFGRSIAVAAGRVVSIDLGGGSTPSAKIAGVWQGAFVVPPPTPLCAAAPAHLSTSTGIDEVDGVIHAVLSGDQDTLLQLVRYSPAPCEVGAKPNGLAPMCWTNEAEGTLVDTLPVASCRARYIRTDEIPSALDEVIGPDVGLFAVYRVPASYWPPGEYVVVFSKSETEFGCHVGGEQLVVAQGRVVGAVLSCGEMPQQVVRTVPPGDFVLAPPTPTPRPTPAGTPTPTLSYWKGDPALAKAVGLYVLDDNGEQRRLADFPAGTPAWSLDGESLYFVGVESGYTGSGVYSVRPDGGELTKVLATSGENHRFSPDLDKVVYQGWEQPAGWTIRVADLTDPASDRKLVDGFLESWSLDGKLVAYFYQVCEPPYAYWVTDLAGSEPRRAIVVTDNVLVFWFTWLPDGKRIAYRTLIRETDGVEPGEAYAIDLGTLKSSLLPELAFVSSEPLFSPDGQWFVYEGDEGLMLTRWGDKSGKRIAEKGRRTVWSPGSDKIAILGQRTVTVYYLADGHSKVTELDSFEPYVRLSLNAAWSPDGTQLALTVGLQGGHGVCD